MLIDIAPNYVISFKKRRFNFLKATIPTLGPLSLAPNVFALNYNFIEVAYCIFNVAPSRRIALYRVTNHIAPDEGLNALF